MQQSVSLMFLPHFEVFCDLLLYRPPGNIESICFIIKRLNIVNNGNKTEWSPTQSAIIQMIDKIGQL